MCLLMQVEELLSQEQGLVVEVKLSLGLALVVAWLAQEQVLVVLDWKEVGEAFDLLREELLPAVEVLVVAWLSLEPVLVVVQLVLVLALVEAQLSLELELEVAWLVQAQELEQSLESPPHSWKGTHQSDHCILLPTNRYHSS